MLSLKNIEYIYQSRASMFKLTIQNLTFEPGVINAILGKNGSGKTTLLNIIGGHLPVNNGSISLFGSEICDLAARHRKVSTVFQTIALFPHLSVRENILLAIQPNKFGKPNDFAEKKIQEILEQFNLQEYSDRKPNQLSIGQQQKVAIARAVATSPMILLLDEPTSALDFENVAYLKRTLRALIETKTVPICCVVSHDLDFVLTIADRIKYLEAGKLIFEGTAQEFKLSKYYVI